ncbi:MAG: glycosyltransferase family 4 protein [Candidatus Aenigmarchaeota archaeon]|nr:glycosyltransferase family 4 protein [Candidatus Aenigmarchaeota archaeon]
MHICYLSELFYPYLFGGAERRYYEIAKRMARKHDVTIYSLRLKGQEHKETVDGMEIRRVGLRHPMTRRRLLPLLSYSVLPSLKSDFDLIDANQGMASFIGYYKSLTKRPIVATFHDIYWDQWKEHFRAPSCWFGKAMEFFWSKARYDRVFANSPLTKEKLQRLGFRSQVDVIVSGINLDQINATRAKKEDNVVLYVGRLVDYKNVDELIRSFAKVRQEIPDARLRIIGTGPEKQRLMQLTHQLGVDVEFRGFLSEREKIIEMKSASVLVNPSSVEGLGLILLESMACGTPVIAKNLPVYFFCNEKNSVLIKDDNYSAPIIEMLNDKARRRAIERSGIKTASQYSWDETARRVEAVYEELVG